MKSPSPYRPLSWFFRIVAALILSQTLFFKFTGAEESKFIFGTLGVEPWGRWLTGVFELVAVVLLVVPGGAALGGLLSLALMAGAIVSHLTKLGIAVQGDGGLLFGLAVAVLLSGAVVVWLHRRELPPLGGLLRGGGGSASKQDGHGS